ncbi:hypothetical protein [Modestobacter italicus]|uniref:hypothetical protein n=1 Tax=Modestobacter italicus (strain DSM 44449 / CECT 9708 / BC 501) TaxID=2732864 RepID=UPI001C971934|nr:hypothetical protein [Modestobacter italicus]
MRAALRLWWALARRQGPDRLTTGLAVLAFAAVTWALLTTLGGLRAFIDRAAVDGAGAETSGTGEVYVVLAVVAAALILVPLITLGGAAARLAVARRNARMAALRLAGATTGQVATMAVADALAQAVAGALAGAALYGVTLPLVALLHFQGRAFAVHELWVGGWAVSALPAVPLVALVSALAALRRVAITPLGVARRTGVPPLSWTRLLPLFALVGVFLLAANGMLHVGAVVLLAILVGTLAGAMWVFNLVGPWLVSVLGRAVARRARTVPTLLAGRRIADDPKAAWRSVGGVALVAFVAGVLSVSPGLAATGAEEDRHLGIDIATGTAVTLVIAALLAAVSTGVTQAGRVLDHAAEYRALHLAGTEVRTLHAARMRETWIPLLVCVGGATVTALALISPFVEALADAPVGVVLFLGSVVAGCALVLAGTAASRRMVERAALAA